MKKEKAVLIGSRIRARDKKNTKYYVGDYCGFATYPAQFTSLVEMIRRSKPNLYMFY